MSITAKVVLRFGFRKNNINWYIFLSQKGVEVAESIVFYGISGNLISFLTENLGQSTAAAAANINAWKGVGCMLPILGAAIADTYVGKYYTIVASSVIYILVSIT